MKMFKKFLVLGFLLLSIAALSKAQDEVPADDAEATTTADPKAAAEETTPGTEAAADDKKSKVKGKSDGGVVDEILTFMKDTCEKIIKFISGKTDGGAVAGKKDSDEEVETTTESADAEDALAGAGKKAKKVLDKLGKKGKKPKDSEESEEAE